jgi:Holliday junction resolvase RusA-like endonuclease
VDASGAQGKEWRIAVQDKAIATFGEFRKPLGCPLALQLTFNLPRPKCHSGKKGLLPSAPPFPAGKPDVLKLARAVEDALTGIIWTDDAQIVTEILLKRYDETPGVSVKIMEAW